MSEKPNQYSNIGEHVGHVMRTNFKCVITFQSNNFNFILFLVAIKYVITFVKIKE